MNYQKRDEELIKKQKEANRKASYNTSTGITSGNKGVRKETVKALDTGSYGKTNTRQVTKRTSQEQVYTPKNTVNVKNTTKSVPVIKSGEPVSVRKNTVQKNGDRSINTLRARQSYMKESEYKPKGRTLSKKDADIIYNGVKDYMKRGANTSKENAARIMRSQAKNGRYIREKDWEGEYGKSLEDILEDYSKNFDAEEERRNKKYGSENKVAATLTSILNSGVVKPAISAENQIATLINPTSKIAQDISKVARNVSKNTEQTREGVTKDMGNVGKTIYNVGTNVADRLAGRAAFGKLGHGATLFRTAEDTRENLEDRGITGRGAVGQSLATGAVDAALDVVGLEKIKGLKGLQQSGNLAKSLVGSAAIGGGEQAITSIINEAIDRVANKDKSNYAMSVQNYMAQGMSQKDAEDAAMSDVVRNVALEAGQGALFGAAMGTGGQVAKKAASTAVDAITGRKIPSLWTPSKSEPVIDNAIRQTEQAAGEIERLRQQIPKVTETEARNERNLERIQETVPGVVENARKQINEPKNYKIDTVNRKGGKKGYYVAEVSENGSRNVMPGKVFKTEAEAQEALNKIQSGKRTQGKGNTSVAKVNDIVRNMDAEESASRLADIERNLQNNNPIENTVAAEKAESNPTLTQNVDETQNPRYVKPLEGADLENANNTIEQNNTRITTIDERISAIENSKKGKKLTNKQAQEIKALNNEKKQLQNTNKALKKQIKGGITPVKELLSNESKKSLFGKYNSVYADLYVAKKIAGDTEQVKTLENEARKYLNQFIESGDINDFSEFVNRAAELQEIAERLGGKYKTKNGEYSYNDWYGTTVDKLGNETNKQLLDSIFERIPFDEIESYHKVPKTVTESAPEAPAPKAPQNPRLQEIDDNLARIDEKLKQYGGSETNTDLEKYHADIRAIDERLERLKDGVLPYEELVKSSANIPEAINDLYSRRAMLSTQLDQIQDGMTTTLPSGREHRLTAQELADHRANIRYLIKQTDNQIIDNTNRFLLATREAARNNLENASAPIEDALSGNVRRQLEQTRERLLKERQSLQNGGGDNGNEPPRVPEEPTEDINRIPTEEAPVNNGGDNVPPNEPPVPPEVPPTPQDSISRRYETLKNSDLFQKSAANMAMLETAKSEGIFNKDVENRVKTQQEALDDYTNNPEAAIERNLNRQWDSGKDVDTSMLILHDALDDGSQAYTNLVLLKQAQQAKKAGRQLRAYRDYAGTKEGTIQKAGQYLNDKADSILSSKKKKADIQSSAERVSSGDLSVLSEKYGMDEANIKNIADALGAGATKADIEKMIAMYQAVGKTGISDNALQKIRDIYDQIEQKNLNPNSRERAELEADAFKVLADDIGGKRTWKEQWDSWRYLAMLGNPKTHLRNVLGNTTHRMVTEIKDNIGAFLEGAVDTANRAMGGQGIERTKALLNANDSNLINRAAEDADNVAYTALNDMGNKYNVKSEIDRARNSFNNRLLSKIDDLNSNALDIEDYNALKSKYSRALARYIKANGVDESVFDAADDMSLAFMEKARAYAIDQAKQATFHEYSRLADALTQFSSNQRQGNIGNKAVGMVVEGLVPFKKTPINILKQGVKYSPISLAKSIATMTNAVRSGNKTASDAIEDLASGLTGTGILALGGFLAHEGLLTGSADPNYDVDNAQTEQGAQNYALKIGNKSYTLDWLAPMALPLFVGAELMNNVGETEDDRDAIDRFISSISTVAEPITEMSMLQGIQNALNELSYSTENIISTFLTNATLGYATQGIPTLFGQIARSIDDTRRSTYTDQPAGYKRQLDKTLTKAENKIPFLSMSNEPYVNMNGQTQQNDGIISSLFGNNIGTRFLDQTLSPGYYKEGTITPVDEELNRLYETMGESVYKNVLSGKVGDEKLSKEDFTKYQTLYGSNNDAFYNDLIGSEEYNALDDAQRVDVIKEAKKISKMIADHEIGGKELKESEQKIYDIYKAKGKDGIIEYLKDLSKADSLGLTYKTYKKKQEEYSNNSTQTVPQLSQTPNTQIKPAESVEEYAEHKQTASDLGIQTKTYEKIGSKAGANADKVYEAIPSLKRVGLGSSSAYYTYANALSIDPNLSSNDFVNTFINIDVDNSKGIKQDELIDYFNRNNTSPEQADQMWRMYGDSTWKKIPKLEGGTYKKVAK